MNFVQEILSDIVENLDPKVRLERVKTLIEKQKEEKVKWDGSTRNFEEPERG